MNERLMALKQSVREREHKRYRQEAPPDVQSECERENLSWSQRTARLITRMCETERVIIEPGDQIVFTRTIPSIPQVYSRDELDELYKNNICHEAGVISNICADWDMVLSQGLLGRRQVALLSRERLKDNSEAVEFIDCAIETIDAVLALAARYAEGASSAGRKDLADILSNVPANRPRTFHEALQALRICHGVIWLGGHYHVGLGRFDQYMWPFLESDLSSGKLTIDEAENLLAEFFISLNKDTDLYPGIQRGDNGQSMMLGGVKRDGSCAVNPLTKMILRVSRDVGMIDPKINLRIDSKTNLELLILATELTRKGLGFPQYANDDVVIPALVAHSYELEDARDYTVAACWEFIIPGKGMEIVNFDWVGFPIEVDKAIREGLTARDNFTGILERAEDNIHNRVSEIAERWPKLLLPPAPYYSVLMNGCLEHGRDLSKGLKYNNIGIHGACSTSAADALAAVKKFVFDEQSVSSDDLLAALKMNYEGYENLLRKLAEDSPRVGNNEDAADEMLVKLFDFFADACENLGNKNGFGIIRPGTGSAMLYIDVARRLGATAEGRKEGEPFSANLAPAPGTHLRGPISVLQSFGKIDYHRICNGGPITMELSDTVFRDADSIRKVAMLVRTFAQVGCQQLQLNALSYDKLIEAKAHPELHRDLIVRVWGWSGYFCELAPEYQDHVIRRYQYGGV